MNHTNEKLPIVYRLYEQNKRVALYGGNYANAVLPYFIAWIKATIVEFGVSATFQLRMNYEIFYIVGQTRKNNIRKWLLKCVVAVVVLDENRMMR